MADTKRDIIGRLKGQARQIDEYATAQASVGGLGDPAFATAVNGVITLMTAEMAAYTTAAALMEAEQPPAPSAPAAPAASAA
jgi:hypothetical protein